MLSKKRLTELLEKISDVKIGIIGDFCVDIYWNADMTKSELSRETPHYPLPVISERVYPGAAGNAAANIAALCPQKISAIGIVGDDWRGDMLKKELNARNIDESGFALEKGRFTNAYCKPMRKGISKTEYEDPRIDFASFTRISEETENIITNNLEIAAKNVDILCVSDQFEYGIITDKVREKIIDLAKNGLTVVVDSRYKIGLYTNVYLKPNEVESWRAVYNNEEYLSAKAEQYEQTAILLAKKNNAKVMQTLGADGSLFTDGNKLNRIKAVKVEGPIDICGAGDTFLSAFSSVLATGAKPVEAAEIASLASAVTVQKISVTGTATREELIKQFELIQ